MLILFISIFIRLRFKVLYDFAKIFNAVTAFWMSFTTLFKIVYIYLVDPASGDMLR